MITKELMKKEYLSWLENNIITNSTKDKYFYAIKIVNKEMRSQGVINKDLFDVDSFEEFKSMYEKIICNNAFIVKDQTGHHMYSCALRKHYGNFLANKFNCKNDIRLSYINEKLLTEIIIALEDLGGAGTINDIIDRIRKRDKLDLSNYKNIEKTLITILNNSSKNKEKIFYCIQIDGKNIWNFKSLQIKEEYKADVSLDLLNDFQKIISGELTEGKIKKIQSYYYERNSKAREECLKHYGTCCQICGCDLSKIYGPEFRGKIHVHHKKPLNQIKCDYVVNPINDLIPICPNCHMIIHCKDSGCYTVEEIKDKIRVNRN